MQDVTNTQLKIFNWDSLWDRVAPEEKNKFLPEVTYLDADYEEWEAGWNQYCLAAGLVNDTEFSGLDINTCEPDLTIL